MAKANLAVRRPRVSTPKSAKQSAKVSTMPAAVNETVEHGKNCQASGQGKDPIAVAVGERSRSVIDVGDVSHMASAVSAGTACRSEVSGHSGAIASVAVGICAEAVSNVKEVPSIAIGYEPHANAIDGGTAISIGRPGPDDVGLSCQAGEGGYLVFVDTNHAEPKVAVFKVDPDEGIWANIPYQWSGGWKTPCPDWERMDREGFERGVKYEREHPGEHRGPKSK